MEKINFLEYKYHRLVQSNNIDFSKQKNRLFHVNHFLNKKVFMFIKTQYIPILIILYLMSKHKSFKKTIGTSECTQ